MLADLSMVEQRYQAVREVLDTEATITDVATRYEGTARPFIAGCCDMQIKVWEHLRTKAASQTAVRIRSHLRSKHESFHFGGLTPVGGHEPSSTNCERNSTRSLLAPRSIDAWSATVLSNPRREGVDARTTSDGNVLAPWSFGRWTSWEAFTS